VKIHVLRFLGMELNHHVLLIPEQILHLAGKPTEVNPMFVPVCVVDNGSFEAAAIAITPEEAEAFDAKSDKRPKTWMLIAVKEAVRLCPKVEGKINWGRK